jgi:hypothetical protein
MPADFNTLNYQNANNDSYSAASDLLGGSPDLNQLSTDLVVPGMVDQDDIDVWMAQASHLPSDESQTVISAFFIDSTGVILPAGQLVSNLSQATSIYMLTFRTQVFSRW